MKERTKKSFYTLRKIIFMMLVFCIRLWRALKYDVGSSPWKLLIAFAIGLISAFIFSLSSGLLWFIFLFFLLYDYDSRYLGAVAILFLTACPVLLALGTEHGQEWAEASAIYAFFFLVMTVAIQVVDLKRHKDESQGDTV